MQKYLLAANQYKKSEIYGVLSNYLAHNVFRMIKEMQIKHQSICNEWIMHEYCPRCSKNVAKDLTEIKKTLTL